MKSARASERAEPGRFRPIRLNLKLFTAYLAFNNSHRDSIPHLMSYGNTDIAVERIQREADQLKMF